MPAAVLCDIDGVVWLARQAISGAPEAVGALRAAGVRVVFVTNNSAAPVAEQEAALKAIGIPARGDVITSAMAAAHLVVPGERVLVCGGPGVAEAVAGRGAYSVAGNDESAGTVDAVVVGFHTDFDYARLRIAAAAVLGGARLIGTNDDPTYPTPAGPIPGGGALLAAVSTAAGAMPIVAGKPFAPMAAIVLDALGRPDPAQLLMVGDRPSTDGRFAVAIGCRFALVRSGVTAPGVDTEPRPDLDGADLAAVVAQVIAAGTGH
ncbi:MAG: HAD-IIA family hydrolase [Actinomycetota bacterium]|nr:HAD-IIA family hydrolase [Actinomycetota bacterium]